MGALVDANKAYSSSKIANGLFGLHLERLSRARGWGLTSNVSHPGVTPTNLLAAQPGMGRSQDTRAIRVIRWIAASPCPFSQTPEKRTHRAVRRAGRRAVAFYGPGAGNLAGAPDEQKPYKPFAGEQDAKRLWKVSEQLTGVQWPST